MFSQTKFLRNFGNEKSYQKNQCKVHERTQKQIIRSTMRQNAKLGYRRRS